MAKKTQLKVPLKTFATKEEFQAFVTNEKEWMYNRIVDAISLSYKKGWLEAKIMEARIEETMSVITMNSEMDDWVESLSLALKWYENQEKYEKCSEILTMIKEIKNYIIILSTA
jgi:hypothetical protein